MLRRRQRVGVRWGANAPSPDPALPVSAQSPSSGAVSAAVNVEEIEIALLIEAIRQRWGYDFRDYAPASLKRRIRRVVAVEGLPTVSALQERVLHDGPTMQRFLDIVTVTVTSMFRDPGFYRAFRLVAVPLLLKRQTLRIWHAGCASGEEVYSMAILLHEENLLARTRIYATDLNQAALDAARDGIYPLKNMQDYTRNYQGSGAKRAFSEYYQAGHGHVAMSADLSANIVWAQHNLATDTSFNEFDLILCRNVMIYFNERLRDRVHRLLYDSLTSDGMLVLGRQEDLGVSSCASCYAALDGPEKIYRRVR